MHIWVTLLFLSKLYFIDFCSNYRQRNSHVNKNLKLCLNFLQTTCFQPEEKNQNPFQYSQLTA